MRLARIAETDLEASVIVMGSGDIGGSIPRELSFRLLDIYIEREGNFIDTAHVYSNWLPGERSRSEKTIGEWMKTRRNRNRLVLATKGCHPELDNLTKARMAPVDIISDLNESLLYLQTDVIDLYYLHRDDPNRPVEEVIETLNDQVKAGKVRYFGCSNWQTKRIRAANEYARRNGLLGFVANQMLWNIAITDFAAIGDNTLAFMDEEMKTYHQATNLAAIAYTSQAHGLFTKMERGDGHANDSEFRNKIYAGGPNLKRFNAIKYIAGQTGYTVTQVVLGYLISQPFPTYPIVGCNSVEQLEDSLRAGDVNLTADQLAEIDEAK
jgi:aryl-alcohol dehydrogenase-like predicted oxidoreductase